MPVRCWIQSCKHNNLSNTCHFFKIPKQPEKQKEWLQLINHVKTPKKNTAICSCHFPDGKKEYGPQLLKTGDSGQNITEESQSSTSGNPHGNQEILIVSITEFSQLANLTEESQSSTSRDVHMESLTEIAQPSLTTSFDIPPTFEDFLNNLEVRSPTSIDVELDASSSIDVKLDASPSNDLVIDARASLPSDVQIDSRPSTSLKISSLLEAEIYFLRKELDSAKTSNRGFSYEQICDNDKSISLYTGLPNAHIFNALYTLVENVPINYYMGWKVEILSRKDQLFLTLMKLRQNFPHGDLAIRFNVSQATVSNIILTWVHVIHEVLYVQVMRDIPSRNKNKTCLQSCFSTLFSTVQKCQWRNKFIVPTNTGVNI